jgi:hypothetical protein
MGFLMIAVLAAAAAGCGGKGEPDAAAPKPAAGGAADDAAQSTQAAGRDEEQRLANAVPTGKAGAAVDLQYEVAPRPEVGAPFEIELTFAPRLAADTLDVQLSSMPGLRITSADTVRFDGVQSGERYAAKVSVIADAPGLYYIGVVARMATKVQAEARAFSIPIVIGTEPVAEKPQPELDAAGEPIESTPAVESTGS